MVASWTYRARRRAGLCGLCGEEPLPGGATCAGCREKMRQHKRRGKGRPKPPRRVEHHVTAPSRTPSEPLPSPPQEPEATPEEAEIQALADVLIETLAVQLGDGKQGEAVVNAAGLFLDWVFQFVEGRDPQWGFSLSREVLAKLIRDRRHRYRAQGPPEARGER